jgi:predicted kinase
MLQALDRCIAATSAAILIKVDAAARLRGRSPAHLLASAAGVGTSGIRSVASFLDSPELAQILFVVEGVHEDEWVTWGIFFRALRAERTRRQRPLGPTVCVVVPNAVSEADVRSATGGSEVRWLGRISSIDTQLYAEKLGAWPGDDLASRAAIAAVVEVAGWDSTLVDALTQMDIECQIDPRSSLDALASNFDGRHPHWANGLVDHWDGQVFVHSLALAAMKDNATLARRVWRGHVRAVFPFLSQVANAFAAKYERHLRAQLPITKVYHSTTRTYSDPFGLELYDMNKLLRDDLPPGERQLLFDCYKLRTSMAHLEPGEVFRVLQASRRWEDLAETFPDGCHGWDWPRCGQRLVLMVGPSGAGKSHWANRNFDAADIVSSDKIREELFGSLDAAGDQTPVFESLRKQVRDKLARGRSALIDSTNLRRDERTMNSLLAPADMHVEYVVIDRPMSEKIATAGWRASKPHLLTTHASLFEQSLPDIVRGDGLPNVQVRDERIASAASSAAPDRIEPR